MILTRNATTATALATLLVTADLAVGPGLAATREEEADATRAATRLVTIVVATTVTIAGALLIAAEEALVAEIATIAVMIAVAAMKEATAVATIVAWIATRDAMTGVTTEALVKNAVALSPAVVNALRITVIAAQLVVALKDADLALANQVSCYFEVRFLDSVLLLES